MLIAAILFIVSAIGCAPRVQRLGPVVLAHRRRPRRRRGIRDRPRLHRRGLAAGLPRPARLAAAARDRLRHLRRPAQRRRRSSRRPARRRRRGCSGSRRGGGCSWSAVVPAAGLRRAGADHPRVAAVPHRARPDDQGEGGPHAGTSAATSRRSRPTSSRPSRASGPSAVRDPPGRQVRPAADRLGRHRPVGAAAVHRHQRDLLLLDDAVAGGRLHEQDSLTITRDHLGDQHRSRRSSRSC